MDQQAITLDQENRRVSVIVHPTGYGSHAEVIQFRALGAYLAERDRAQRTLIKATLIELALGSPTCWTLRPTRPPSMSRPSAA
jgi:hypothetical protein